LSLDDFWGVCFLFMLSVMFSFPFLGRELTEIRGVVVVLSVGLGVVV